jgi:hypothetical protein
VPLLDSDYQIEHGYAIAAISRVPPGDHPLIQTSKGSVASTSSNLQSNQGRHDHVRARREVPLASVDGALDWMTHLPALPTRIGKTCNGNIPSPQALHSPRYALHHRSIRHVMAHLIGLVFLYVRARLVALARRLRCPAR